MRVCLFCKNFHFNPGEPDYSEYTPGTDWYMECWIRVKTTGPNKGEPAGPGQGAAIWELRGYNYEIGDERLLREKMRTAETCKYYEPVEGCEDE